MHVSFLIILIFDIFESFFLTIIAKDIFLSKK